MTKNYYIVLGVASDATLDQIKAAYRRRALELHPDRSGSDSEPFIKVQEAYRILCDQARREAYDREAQLRSGRARGEPLRATRAAAEPFAREDLADISIQASFECYHPSFDEIFNRLWSNFDTVTRPKAERIESLMIEIPLSRGQARQGGETRVLIPARAECPTCGGGGAVGSYECWRCAGQGAITGEHPVLISFPAGIRHNHLLRVRLDQFGIHNFYLTVRFRITEGVTPV